MADKIRVFIADQQPLFRKGVSQALTSVGNIEVCGDASLDTDLMPTLEAHSADVLLLDIDFPTLRGLDIAWNIKQHLPSIAIIILTPNATDEQLFQAIKARASAFLSRHVTADELTNTITRVASGQYPINEAFVSQPKLAERILRQFQEPSWGKESLTLASPVSPLTPRETQVLNYLARGYLNKQIAAMLSISEQTIKNHVTSIPRKLDANVRTQAVVNAVRRGIISLEERA